ncbi:hypothetical protein [Ketogulonicigenium vulgare]|uniref:hypothetical protein n=1 Tax=Ketogulonicigenium vulgare TaxID=92945 RepID=UPI0020C7D068|nr:hypothetical protein [Ketogulonicigenium vulgare]
MFRRLHRLAKGRDQRRYRHAIAGTGTPFTAVSRANPLGSICTSRDARVMNSAESSGISPSSPCTSAKAPSTSSIARTTALSENSASTSASPNRPR